MKLSKENGNEKVKIQLGYFRELCVFKDSVIKGYSSSNIYASTIYELAASKVSGIFTSPHISTNLGDLWRNITTNIKVIW